MLDTVVLYCPASVLSATTAAGTTAITLGASYDGATCPSAMECHIRYALDWQAPSSMWEGDCVAPPTPAPTTPTSATHAPADSESDDDGESPDSTPAPTSTGGGDLRQPMGNRLSRAVQCAERWANCTTMESDVTYDDDWHGKGCTKLERVVGEVRNFCRPGFRLRIGAACK